MVSGAAGLVVFLVVIVLLTLGILLISVNLGRSSAHPSNSVFFCCCRSVARHGELPRPPTLSEGGWIGRGLAANQPRPPSAKPLAHEDSPVAPVEPAPGLLEAQLGVDRIGSKIQRCPACVSGPYSRKTAPAE